MRITLDKDLAATMTPEELAVINDEEYSAEELAAMKGIAGDDDDNDDDDQNSPGTPVVPVVSPVVAPDPGKADDNKVVEQDLANEPEELADTTSRITSYNTTLPENYDDLVKESNEEADALAKQLNDGELDMSEYTQKLATVNEHRAQLRDMRTKAELLDEINQQNTAQAWQKTVNTFVNKAAKVDGIDYRKDTEKANDLDLFVKRLADIPANNERPMEWFMAEAHKRVMALHGIQKSAPVVEPKKDPVAAARQERKQPIDQLPKTLAQVPGADGPGDIAGEFADLDALDGMELEDAIAKMTPAQRTRYLNG